MSSATNWRGRLGAVGLTALLLAAAGCYQHVFVVGAGAPAGTLVHDEWRHHWLWGLVSPDNELAIEQVCPSGNATILGEVSFLNGLVSALTGGIYSPTTVRVRCAGASAALDIPLSADDVTRIVASRDFLQWVEEVAPDRLGEVRSAQRDLLAE